ncbi:MAG: RHS repeat-associated core domain-containing protein [Holophagales bacterium]|nr:MAG: RHS repeat-associated core domain-containing protein [Holophagales bacterium]
MSASLLGRILTKTETVGSATRVWECAYDPERGRLKEVNPVNGVLTKGWLYAGGLAPVAEVDALGQVTATFVYATKGNVPDDVLRDGTSYRLFADHLGSVRLVVEATTGALVQQIDDDAFGRILYDSNPGFQPFGFAGGLHDPQTGLTRFGARDYDPEVGRWTSKDPIGFGGGSAGLYEYVGNDPANAVDSSGLWITPWEVLDLWSYQQSSAEFSNAVSLFSENPSGANALLIGTSFVTASADAAALVLPVVPAWGGLVLRSVRAGEIVVGGIKANRAAGHAAEEFLLATYGGDRWASRPTSLGRRFIDNLANGVARESKVGRTALTPRIEMQIAKDVELLNTAGSGVLKVEWHFFPGPTGLGPTEPLRKALKEAGIAIISH